MKANIWKITTIVLAVVFAASFVVAVALGPCTHMLDCGDSQQHMKCYWAYRAVAVLSATGAFSAIAACAVNNKEGRYAVLVTILLQLIAAVFLFSSFGIGTCGGEDMACNVHGIAIRVLHALAIICCIICTVKADPQEAAKPKMSL